MFRYPEDKPIAAIVVATTLLSFALYLWVDNPWILLGYWAVMLVPRGGISAWNHNHQHCFTFKSTALNRLLELCYAFHTGMGTHTWVLHHVYGHHLNYLDQSKDESRWQRRSGKKMGALEYIAVISLTSYYRSFRVGQRFPKERRSFVVFGLLTLAIVAALVAWRPVPGLLVFVLPMVTTLMWTAWATYDHHAGLPTDDQWSASYNVLGRFYNVIACNLGYHTAHHHRPGVHWSRLPALHERIQHKIPPHLVEQWKFVLKR